MFAKASQNKLEEAAEGLDEPFLANDEKEDRAIIGDSTTATRHTCIWRRFHAAAVILHLALIALYTTLYLINRHPPTPSTRLWSPASDAVTYELHLLDALGGDSPYFSPVPGPKSDEAWTRILENMNIRVLPEEMTRLGETSLELADGSGSVGTLGVYHQLHCLKRIRHWIERDHYMPNMTSEEQHDNYFHMNHCLELVRQAIVCNSDTTFNPFEWIYSGEGIRGGFEPAMKMGVQHACVDWDRLQNWASSRRVNLHDPELLVVPESES